MAILKKKSKSTETSNDFEVIQNHGVLHFDTIRIKENVNGKEYIATPYGAVYLIKDLKPGLFSVQEFKNGMLGLKTANIEQKICFLNEQKAKFDGLSISDLKAMYSL